MKKEVTLEMTQKQINRYHVINDSLERKVTVREAANALGLSERQVIRLRKGVENEGARFLIHKNKDKPSMRAASSEVKTKVVKLYCSDLYKGSNFLHFTELLRENEDITLSYSVVRKMLIKEEISSPKKRRRTTSHKSRKRKPQEGLLIQTDATPYEWFGGSEKNALHGCIDDATGNITGLYMTKNECLHGYFEVTRQTIIRNGVPISMYADRHTIFRSPKQDKLSIEEQLAGRVANDTQFGRAVKELGITLIPARSPQAKGRIERLWETLQSRLVTEFRIHNIKTVHAANAFMADYIPKFNKRFGVEAEQTEKAYVQTKLDLDLILCVKEKRTIDNGGVFSFHSKQFKVISTCIPNKARVEVIASATRGIVALYKGEVLEVLPYIRPKKTKENKEQNNPHVPSDDHYYKRGKPTLPLYSSDLVDKEVFKILNEIFL